MHTQRGDISVYMALLIMLLMLSSALVLSLILARQIRATEDVVETERSFYAANSGLEHTLYVLTKGIDPEQYSEDIITKTGSVVYVGPGGSETATYEVEGKYNPPPADSYCVRAEGEFRNETRRLQLGPADCL